MSVRPEKNHEGVIFGFLDSISGVFSGSGVYSGIGEGKGGKEQKVEQNKNEHRTKIEQNYKIFLKSRLYFLLFTIFG